MTAPTEIKPGQIFGKLKMLEEVERGKHGERRWSVRCECGTRKVYRLGHITQGRVVSCGSPECRDPEKYRSAMVQRGRAKGAIEEQYGRVCAECFERKSLTEFYKKGRGNIYSSYCKGCTKSKTAARHLKRQGRAEPLPPKPPPKRERRLVIAGEQFGFLTTLKETPARDGKRVRWVLARCRCGSEREYRLHCLWSGNTKSCGCIPRGQGAHVREERRQSRQSEAPWAR